MDLDIVHDDDIVIPEINILNKDECVHVLQEVVDPLSPSLNYGLDLYRLLMALLNCISDSQKLGITDNYSPHDSSQSPTIYHQN